MYLPRLHTVLLESDIVLNVPSSVSDVFVINGTGYARILLCCSHISDLVLSKEEVHMIESGIVSLVLEELKDEPIDWGNSLILVRLHTPDPPPPTPSSEAVDAPLPSEVEEGKTEKVDSFLVEEDEKPASPCPSPPPSLPSAPSKRHENFLSWCGTYFPIAKEEVAALLFSQACDLFIRSYAWKNVERMQIHVPFASQRFCAHLEEHGMSGTLFVRALELLLPPIETFLLPQYYKEVVDFSSKVHGWDVSTLLEIVDAVAHHSDPNPPEGVLILRSMLFV